jgi:hypothetical protein
LQFMKSCGSAPLSVDRVSLAHRMLLQMREVRVSVTPVSQCVCV